MEKKNNFSCMKQQELTSALNDCLPKILQILEVTLNKLILRMDSDACERSEKKFKDLQNQTNNNTIHVYINSYKKQKLGFNVNDAEDEEETEYLAKRLILAHTIIDLLNTIEAGSKVQVLRTTEVCRTWVMLILHYIFMMCLFYL